MEFQQLIEQREPQFRSALAITNDFVARLCLQCVPSVGVLQPRVPSLPVFSKAGLDLSGTAQPVTPKTVDEASDPPGLPESTMFYPPCHEAFKAASSFTAPNLDVLLKSSRCQIASDQQTNSLVQQCYLWPSARFEDLETQPQWFPRFQRQRLEPCRFQFLPFFYTTRWQLAVFDTFEKSLVCYDPMWPMGSPTFLFMVSGPFL